MVGIVSVVFNFIKLKENDGSNYDYQPENSGYGYRNLVLADGTSVLFDFLVSPNCTAHENNFPGSRDGCTSISIDVNGKKGPNQWGRDLFAFVLKNNGLYPEGCDVSGGCLSDTGALLGGRGCACKVLKEGAINY